MPFQCHFLGFRVKFPPSNSSSVTKLSQCCKSNRFVHLPSYLVQLSLSALAIFNMVDRWRRNITLSGLLNHISGIHVVLFIINQLIKRICYSDIKYIYYQRFHMI